MVGVSGFEPEASWTRTKRDTKLRHAPKQREHYMKNFNFCQGDFLILQQILSCKKEDCFLRNSPLFTQ